MRKSIVSLSAMFLLSFFTFNLWAQPFYQMQGFNAQRTGQSIYQGPIIPKVKWQYDLKRFWVSDSFSIRMQDNACPVIGKNGTVFIPAESDFFALNTDGTLKWRKYDVFSKPPIDPPPTPTPHPGDTTWKVSWTTMRNAPGISNDGSKVYAVSQITGTILLSGPPPFPGWSPFIINNCVTALSTVNGEVLWNFKFSGIADTVAGHAITTTANVSYSSFAVDKNDVIYIGTRSPAAVYAINPNGTLKWSYTQPNSAGIGIEAPLTVDLKGNVYAIVNTIGLIALDSNGVFKWKNNENTGGYGWPTPAIGQDGTIYVAGDDGSKLIALNHDGTKKWERTDIGGPGGYFAGIAISHDNETIYASRAKGRIYSLEAASGKTLWKSDSLSESCGSSLILSKDGLIFLRGNGKHLYALQTVDGSLLWSYELNTPSNYWGPQSPALSSDGTLYAVASGTVKAYGDNPARIYAFEFTPNKKPSVILTVPASGATFLSPAIINMVANASDTDGTIKRVEFIANGLNVGNDTTSSDGYSCSWNSPGNGQYTLKAIASDNYGIKSESEPVNIVVSGQTSIASTNAVKERGFSLSLRHNQLFFSISYTSIVKVGLFNLNGKLISYLINGSYTCGSYKIDLSKCSISSGYYIISGNIGNHIYKKRFYLF